MNEQSLRNTLAYISALLLVGCAGSTVVDVDVIPEVTRYTASGLRAPDHPDRITVIQPIDIALNRFPARSFDGGDFEWTFSAGGRGFGGSITNKSPHLICLRFDEASISSNLNTIEKPLQIWHMHWTSGKTIVGWIGSTNPKYRQLVAPVKVCVNPDTSVNVSIGPELTEQFAQGTMFGIEWREGSSEIRQEGIGNWLLVRLPIDNNQARERIDIKLTASRVRGRVSHY